MNNNINILVVEDDEDINNLLYKILDKQGYRVTSAYSGSEAKMCLERQYFQLVLLDLMLPAISGENLISEIRKFKTMPIIVISAKPGQDIKIKVLKLGADDFICKPFDTNEVLARVESQLRRYTIFSNSCNKNDKDNILVYEDLILNRETVEVTVKNKYVPLTAREFTILELLMSNPNKVFTKSNLFEHVWNEDFFCDDNTVNVHISNIRSKLAKVNPNTEYIHTVWGIGYKISDKT
ncbi:response regulator transcription factor [Clostridium cochlearium]|uniref:response regulator transcription factor n=1 Tax=Clostridium cochlearium TaxID=1494 RepID=UPI00214A2A6E|nr:response regulator transcription factor [Clostridium cochlearium]MBE6065587.1 response regulator transcription factor [Clostridium cochlearium]MCR1972050.1 response regulator transcription factor [Clostridium cochlearium]